MTGMADLHESLPPKAWKDMDDRERQEAARLLRVAANQAFQAMIDELNVELQVRQCPLRCGGALVVTWDEPLAP